MSHSFELNSDTYINRELSWIEFNRRVLAEAQDPQLPLLERLRFIGIFCSNLDEFYMVRVASYHQKVNAGQNRQRPDGHTPLTLLNMISERVRELETTMYATLRDLLTELEAHQVFVRSVSDLDSVQQAALRDYFSESIFPVLTPLAVDHARPFPFISNLSLNLIIVLRHKGDTDGEQEFVRLKVPDLLPRLLHVGSIVQRVAGVSIETPDTFVWVEDVIANNLDLLFSGMEVVEHSLFRVTRNADIDYEHEQDNGLTDVFEMCQMPFHNACSCGSANS
jgi:polyphosphate kinase